MTNDIKKYTFCQALFLLFELFSRRIALRRGIKAGKADRLPMIIAQKHK
jgi:hypothetical protein